MSHSQKIKTNFVDLTCLKAALASFGWNDVQERTTAKTYSGDSARTRIYDYVAVNPHRGGYDLGFMQEGNKIEAYGDFFGGSLEQSFGNNLKELKKAYSNSVFTTEWEAQGFTVFATEDERGGILLEAELA